MNRYKLIFILFFITALWSCNDKPVDLNLKSVMENYFGHFTMLAEGVEGNNHQAVAQAAGEFKSFFRSHLHQKWMKAMEPESRSRHHKIFESMERLGNAARENDSERMKSSFRDIRYQCLDCHFITRKGNKKSFLDGELPDISDYEGSHGN